MTPNPLRVVLMLVALGIAGSILGISISLADRTAISNDHNSIIEHRVRNELYHVCFLDRLDRLEALEMGWIESPEQMPVDCPTPIDLEDL